MQTCQNDLGLNLYVVPPTSRMVAISENSLIRRGVKHIAIDTRDLVSTLVSQIRYSLVVILELNSVSLVKHYIGVQIWRGENSV